MPSLDNGEFRPKRRRIKHSSAPISVRLNAYLLAVFAKGTRVYTLDFDGLARSFRCTRRTVEMAVKKLRTGTRFDFRTIRVGRSYAVQVSDRNPSIKGVFSLKRKKEIPNTTPQPARVLEKSSGWVSKPAPRRIQALAAWFARNELAKIHRAGARTMFRIGHALNFALQQAEECRALLWLHLVTAGPHGTGNVGEPLTDMLKRAFASKKKPPQTVEPEAEPIEITTAPAAPVAAPSTFEKV